MDVIEALKWRYAVKKFDPTKKLSPLQVDRLLDGLCLTATSMGMQLMEFLVVGDAKLKEKLLPYAYNQPQITDCSHLFIMCRKSTVKWEDIRELIDLTSSKRGIEKNDLEGFEQMLASSLQMSPAQQATWMENQVYIAMGNLMTICAVEQVDACPMEGFNNAALDDFLNLNKKGLNSVLLCAVGYRSKEDKYDGLKKVRRSKNKLVTFLD